MIHALNIVKSDSRLVIVAVRKHYAMTELCRASDMIWTLFSPFIPPHHETQSSDCPVHDWEEISSARRCSADMNSSLCFLVIVPLPTSSSLASAPPAEVAISFSPSAPRSQSTGGLCINSTLGIPCPLLLFWPLDWSRISLGRG